MTDRLELARHAGRQRGARDQQSARLHARATWALAASELERLKEQLTDVRQHARSGARDPQPARRRRRRGSRRQHRQRAARLRTHGRAQPASRSIHAPASTGRIRLTSNQLLHQARLLDQLARRTQGAEPTSSSCRRSIVNLLTNARAGADRLTVRTTRSASAPGPTRPASAVIEVEDNGRGMSEDSRGWRCSSRSSRPRRPGTAPGSASASAAASSPASVARSRVESELGRGQSLSRALAGLQRGATDAAQRRAASTPRAASPQLARRPRADAQGAGDRRRADDPHARDASCCRATFR